MRTGCVRVYICVAGAVASAPATAQAPVMGLGSKTIKRSLVASQAAGAMSFARGEEASWPQSFDCRRCWMIAAHLISHMQRAVGNPPHARHPYAELCCWRAVVVVLDSVHELLLAGKQTTQRDLYYKVRAGQGRGGGHTRHATRRATCPLCMSREH